MTGRETMKAIMEAKEISNADLAHSLGISLAAAWDRVNSVKLKDISSSILAQTLGAMGYKLVAIPEEVDIPESAFIID